MPRRDARPAPFLRACAAALAVSALALPAAATKRAPEAPEDVEVPDSSRWSSFAQLVASRWTARVDAETDPAERAVLYRRCVEDAWFLPLPALVRDAASPCPRLLADRPSRAKKAVRDDWRKRFSGTTVTAPSREQYFGCVRDAGDRADPALVPICAMALRPRAQLVAAVDDTERFGGWLSECKRVMLGPAPVAAGETARPAPTSSGPTRAADDVHARHCFRTLPALYEVQWLRKVGDFWTPEEQRRLHARARELGLQE